MDGIGGKPGWAWIFFLEGLVTVICAIVSFWVIDDFPDTAKFLTEEERTSRTEHAHQLLSILPMSTGVWVIRRLQADLKFSAGGESFRWQYLWQCLTDWKTYFASKLPFRSWLIVF